MTDLPDSGQVTKPNMTARDVREAQRNTKPLTEDERRIVEKYGDQFIEVDQKPMARVLDQTTYPIDGQVGPDARELAEVRATLAERERIKRIIETHPAWGDTVLLSRPRLLAAIEEPTDA